MQCLNRRSILTYVTHAFSATITHQIILHYSLPLQFKKEVLFSPISRDMFLCSYTNIYVALILKCCSKFQHLSEEIWLKSNICIFIHRGEEKLDWLCSVFQFSGFKGQFEDKTNDKHQQYLPFHWKSWITLFKPTLLGPWAYRLRRGSLDLD